MAELTRAPIDVPALIARASRPECGAVSAFVGNSRDHHEGRRVLKLEYEAYDSMALGALAALERAAVARFEVAACDIVHRLGEVPIGEASVVVVVAAPHRAAAFAACQWAMDELKRSVPVWKKEFFAEGDTGWVSGTKLG